MSNFNIIILTFSKKTEDFNSENYFLEVLTIFCGF